MAIEGSGHPIGSSKPSGTNVGQSQRSQESVSPGTISWYLVGQESSKLKWRLSLSQEQEPRVMAKKRLEINRFI